MACEKPKKTTLTLSASTAKQITAEAEKRKQPYFAVMCETLIKERLQELTKEQPGKLNETG